MYAFGALLMRMNYINRWGLMRNTRTESLSEHAVVTASVANILSCIAREMYDADVDPGRVTCRALYHDAGEILNGDLPTPVKYRNDAIREAYGVLEAESEKRILDTLPEQLREAIAPLICGGNLNEREGRIVKAADKFSALIKCIEERRSGNMEFASAERSTLAILQRDMLPETAYFLEHFIPAYSLTLDELLKTQETP